MRVGHVIYARHCGFSLVLRGIQYDSRPGHTRLSSRHSLVTRVQLQSVEHNHSGVTASCSIILRVVQSDLQGTTDMAG